MNYSRIYNSLIDNAKARIVPSEYVELHHIVPKSLGGSNEKENLVYLTSISMIANRRSYAEVA